METGAVDTNQAGLGGVPGFGAAHSSIPPLPRTPLIGRTHDVEEIADRLAGEGDPFITLVGPGGVGKTRLAIHVARAVAPRLADGVVFVSLAPVRDPELVIPIIARAIGISEVAGRSMTEQLTLALADREMLLVLDNLEQVIEIAPELARLQAACPRLRILATSRIPLRITVEQRIVIDPLAVPAITPDMPLAEIGAHTAVQLFVARAGAISSDFSLSAENASHIAAICARLDGLPLAIELAASRLRLFDVPALHARLEPSLPLLTGGARDQPDRLRTMHDAIRWSYDLLTPTEQALFRRLSVFTGGFDLDSAVAIAGDSIELIDGITSLFEKSLLRQTTRPGSDLPRYQMLETVREFGMQQLAGHGEEQGVRAAHARYLHDLVVNVFEQIDGPDYEQALERVDVEHDNVRSALAWASSAGNPSDALRMATALARFWVVRGYYAEGRSWLLRVITETPATPIPERLETLRAAGWLARLQGDASTAARFQTEALEGARATGDELNASAALQELSLVEMHRGNFQLGVEHIEAALDLVRRAEQTVPNGAQLVSVVLANVGQVTLAHGDVERAITASGEAVDRQRALGYTWALGDTLRILGDAFYEHGEFNRALAAYRESVELTRDEGDRRFLSNALCGIGNVAAALRWPSRAVLLFAAVTKLREQIGAGLEIWQTERYERALAIAKSSLSPEKFAATWHEGETLSPEAIVAEAMADFDDADATATAITTGSGRIVHLTPREFEVLRLVSDGLTDRDIAELLQIRPRTVNFHVTNLLDKLGVDSRTAVAIFAVRHGLV